MQIGFEVVAAQSKKRDADDQPSQVPMRPAPASIRRSPSADQLKARKQMRRKTAGLEDLDLAALVNEERDWSAKLNNARTPESVAAVNDHLDKVRAEIAKREGKTAVAKTGSLSPEDAKFLYEHAKAYAQGDDAYAAWYMAEYAGNANGLEDVPDHPDAWDKYLQAKGDDDSDPSEGADDQTDDNPFAKKESRLAATEGTHDWRREDPIHGLGTTWVCARCGVYAQSKTDYERRHGTACTAPKKESRMTTEADLLAKMAAAPNLTEQAEYGRQLAALRAARIQGQREAAGLDLANTIVESRFPTLPAAPSQIGVTASSDWLGTVEPDSRPTAQVEGLMRAEASVWYNARPEAVRADEHEITAQAVGYGRRVASQFGLEAEAAYQAFLGAVEHLHTTARRRTALDEVQQPPYQAPVNDVKYPTNTDTFDDALSTPTADPKTGQDTPSLAEGDSPEGDSSPQVMNPVADSADHDKASKDTSATDYIDGTSTPNRQGGNETFSSLVRQAESESEMLYPDRNSSGRGSDNASEQTPSLTEGDAPEGDQSQGEVEAPPSGDLDKSKGDTATDYLDGQTYPSHFSSLRAVAASIESDEATVGRQVHPNARPFLAAMHQVEAVSDSFVGVTGAEIVEHFLRQARLGGPNAALHIQALNAHLRGDAVPFGERKTAGEVPESFKKNWDKDDDDEDNGSGDAEKNSQHDSDDDDDSSEEGDGDKPDWLKKKIDKGSAKTANDADDAQASAERGGDDGLLGGQTCAKCGAPIERDPKGEDNRSWHHNDGDKHDHEAVPSSKTSAKTAAEYQGGSPKAGDTAKCHKDGKSIEFFDGAWYHLNSDPAPSHDDVYPPNKSERNEVNSSLSAFAARVQANLGVTASEWSDAHPGKERCPATKNMGMQGKSEPQYARCTREKHSDGEHEFDGSKARPGSPGY